MRKTVNLKYLFDRPRKDHPWKETFSSLNRKKLNHRRSSVLQNFEMDQKVSEDRESFMIGDPELKESDADFDTWKNSQEKYFKKHLCRAGSDTYRSVNRNNRIPDNVLKHKQLVHVTSVNKLILRLSNHTSVHERRFREITGFSFKAFQNKKSLNFDKVQELTENIGRKQDGVSDFARLILKSSAHNQPPWWACFAQDVSHCIKNKEWNLLVRKLGLGHYEKNETILIWIYPAKIAGSFYRPTVIESNCDPYHFPLTDHIEQETMPLVKNAKTGISEIVHNPVDPKYIGECRFWIGRITENIKDDVHDNVEQYRKLHWKRLKKRYSDNPGIKLWIARHNYD